MNIPFHIAGELRIHLDRMKLLQCYDCNRQDFIDMVGLLYADHRNSRFAVRMERKDGFSFFCTAIVQALQAAPTQLNKKSVDNEGNVVNIFGAFLLRHLPQLPSMQNLLASNGEEKYHSEWHGIKGFATYVGIEAFKNGVAEWRKDDIDRAKRRQLQLLNGDRALRYRRFFD